jgi:hypothetical protein
MIQGSRRAPMNRRLRGVVLGVASASIGVILAATAAERRTEQALPFIEDDYHRALVEAKERKLPIFVESWTPW